MVRFGELFLHQVMHNGVFDSRVALMKSSLRRYTVALLCFCVVTAGASAGVVDDVSKIKADDAVQDKLLVDGIAVMKSGDPAGAMRDYFDRMIAANDQRIAAAGKKVYAARTPVESLAYLAAAANSQTGAVVYASQMTYAHFMKAYVLIELHRDAEAKAELDAALALSPDNAQVLDELGSWYERQKDWDHALQNFQRAQDAAPLSPPAAKNFELSAAWRGIGYVYVEQHRLADAEQMYLKCLELDANDKKAAGELAYVRARQQKEGAH